MRMRVLCVCVCARAHAPRSREWERVAAGQISLYAQRRCMGIIGGHALAKMRATAAPMKPKNGAEGGHSGLVSDIMPAVRVRAESFTPIGVWRNSPACVFSALIFFSTKDKWSALLHYTVL